MLFLPQLQIFSCETHRHSSKRLYDSYRQISETPQRYASLVLANSDFTHALTHDLNLSEPTVLIKRKAGRIDNFMSHAFSKLSHGRNFNLLISLSAVASLVYGILYYLLKGKDVAAAVRAAAISSCFIAPFISSLVEILPLSSLQSKLSKLGTVVPGYNSLCGIRTDSFL